jgi:hypothetical protein
MYNYVCRKFDTLTAVMHEDNNWAAYRKEVEQKLDTSSPFIPFLGVFLTTTAYHQTASQAKQRASSVVSFVSGGGKVEENAHMYETYHLLEAITVRQRLDKLRQDSFAQDGEEGGRLTPQKWGGEGLIRGEGVTPIW